MSSFRFFSSFFFLISSLYFSLFISSLAFHFSFFLYSCLSSFFSLISHPPIRACPHPSLFSLYSSLLLTSSIILLLIIIFSSSSVHLLLILLLISFPISSCIIITSPHYLQYPLPLLPIVLNPSSLFLPSVGYRLVPLPQTQHSSLSSLFILIPVSFTALTSFGPFFCLPMTTYFAPPLFLFCLLFLLLTHLFFLFLLLLLTTPSSPPYSLSSQFFLLFCFSISFPS